MEEEKQVIEVFTKKLNINKNLVGSIYSQQKTVQVLSEILKTVENTIDYSKFEGVDDILHILSNTAISENSFLNYLREKLLNLTKCANCDSSKETITNACGHSFCHDCCRTNMSQVCSSCSKPLTDQFLLLIKKRVCPDNRIYCKKCRSCPIFDLSMNPCGHLCYGCIHSSIQRLEANCFHCNEPLVPNLQNLLNMQVNCEGCGEKRYYIGDFLALVCSHPKGFCITCMEKMLVSKSCILCSKKLKTRELLIIYNSICDTCGRCKKDYSKSFLEPRSCCKKRFCVYCFNEMNGICC